MDDPSRIESLAAVLARARKVAVLTGAGISAESGIPTFRGQDGLWKRYRAEELATPTAFAADPRLVWEWYDWRRGIIGSKQPNLGHSVLASWETIFPDFNIITQNIDGFHPRAGSRNVLELHGNIWKLRCTSETTVTENHEVPLPDIPPRCASCGAMLRPHVVWFGESLDMSVLNRAFELSGECDVMLVVGTSAVVQPAASLPLAARSAGATLVEVNPDPTPLTPLADFSLPGKAGEVLSEIDLALRQALGKSKDRKP